MVIKCKKDMSNSHYPQVRTWNVTFNLKPITLPTEVKG